MTEWTDEELRLVGEAQELQLASARRGGTMRPYVTMWVVRVGDDLYVRSAYGPDNPWYRRAKASGAGRIRAGGVERDVAFAEPAPSVHADIDAAYHAKYDRYGPRLVDTVVGPEVEAVTIKLIPPLHRGLIGMDMPAHRACGVTRLRERRGHPAFAGRGHPQRGRARCRM
jgi:hypothetical protein